MMSFSRVAVLASLVAGAVFAAEESTDALPKFSPFGPRGEAATVIAANENLEFAGVSSIGTKTDLIFYDKVAKKSHWIAMGETKEGISVLNYDSRREQAVVRVNGVQKTLPLRPAHGPAHGPAPVTPMPVGFNTPPPAAVTAPVTSAPAPMVTQPPATNPPASAPVIEQPATPAGPGTPEVQKKQETEARMLVSDLLEIGMAQRKAYEEAQRRAADPNSPPPAPPAPPANSAPAPKP